MVQDSAENVFDRHVRVLVCPQCGAPYEIDPSGGSVTCTYCGATAQVAPRKPALTSQSQISESARFEKLRSQDGQPFVPPAGIIKYVRAGQLDPARLEAALKEWQQLREDLLQGASFPSQEKMYFLTIFIAQYYSADDPTRQRAFMETALETLDDRRYRQVLSAIMCRNAVRAGQVSDAEAWLETCDPKSEDLHMDTAWRHARAFLDIGQGDFKAVLETIGRDLNDLPLADYQEEAIGVLRAHALEKLGDVNTAVAQLTALSARSAQGTGVINSVIKLNKALDLCPISGPALMASMSATTSGPTTSYTVQTTISHGAPPAKRGMSKLNMFAIVLVIGAVVMVTMGISILSILSLLITSFM